MPLNKSIIQVYIILDQGWPQLVLQSTAELNQLHVEAKSLAEAGLYAVCRHAVSNDAVCA